MVKQIFPVPNTEPEILDKSLREESRCFDELGLAESV
jgi:hypothetical protein